MNNETCKNCVYNNLTIDFQSKAITKNCVRYPPASHAVPTNQGIALMCAYPVIKDDMPACGEWDDGVDITIEHSDKLSI